MNKDAAAHASKYKLKHPCRNQMEMQFNCLDTLLPADHRARDIWDFVNSLDTRPCYAQLNTFDGKDGRPAISPQVLLALWIYSILDGNISARKLSTLCESHNAYKWIAGGVQINRTTLSDFRKLNPFVFEDLLTNCLAVMLKSGLIEDTDFAQDGTRVKANAGFNSYHREATLEEMRKKIKEYIANLSEDSYESKQNSKDAAIKENRLKRVEEALAMIQNERTIKEDNGNKNRQPPTQEDLIEVRGSTTDPAARKMKMGDGGFRLAYNVQLATGIDSRVIFGVDVVTTLDPGTSPRMMAAVHSRLRTLNMEAPQNWIGDCAYSAKSDVEDAARFFPNCRYYAPPKTKSGIDPKRHRKTDSPAVKKWRDLIGQEDVKELYKHRCSTAEFSNAQMKNRGWGQFLVRGLERVKSCAILHAIAHNISRYFNLRDRKRVTA